jgi:hypothetical protein
MDEAGALDLRSHGEALEWDYFYFHWELGFVWSLRGYTEDAQSF